MHIHYLQHIALETPGYILDWAAAHAHTLSHTAFFSSEPLPDTLDFDLLIVMGGPMNIYEESFYPWLAAEKEFIKQAIRAGKVVLGICLGAQLVADVLGGKVTCGQWPEIGWLPIRWNDEACRNPLFAGFPVQATVFEWHYDTFSTLPNGAVSLASSVGCAQQAFAYGDRVFGFQFHLENTMEMLKGYIETGAAEMRAGRFTQTPDEVLAHVEHLKQNHHWLQLFLNALEVLVDRIDAS